MCIPPINENSEKHFKKMRELNDKLGLKQLSMGMSADYLNAIKYGSTYVRIGSGYLAREVKEFYFSIFFDQF